ncbi:MAG: putative acetyltransferase [Flavobacteriales bacterium]|jgi:putative acetyltransferase
MIQLREATPVDLQSILKVFTDCIDITAVPDYNEEQRRVWKSSALTPEKWLDRIHQQAFWLACEEDKVAGFATLENNNYIDCMYVSPGFQGNGIAHLLLETIEDLAQRKGTQLISSDVSHTARGFFEKNSYQIIHTNQIEKDGVVLVNFKVEKHL